MVQKFQTLKFRAEYLNSVCANSLFNLYIHKTWVWHGYVQLSLFTNVNTVEMLFFLKLHHVSHTLFYYRLSGLSHLKHLSTLMVSQNQISVVEGLPKSLQVLVVAHQKIAEPLLLDPHHLARAAVSMQMKEFGLNCFLHHAWHAVTKIWF